MSASNLRRSFRHLPLAAMAIAVPTLIGACGPATPASTTPTPVPSSSASLARSMTPPDLSPVDAPTGIVAELHLSSPRAIARAAKTYTSRAAGALDKKLDARAMVASDVLGPALAQIVDIDQSVDASLILRTPDMPAPTSPMAKHEPVFGIAFALEDELDDGAIAAHLKSGFRVEPSPGHILKLVPVRAYKYGDADYGSFDGDCVIAPAFGPAKRRLICTGDSNRVEDLGVLVPWLTRGVTRRQAPPGAIQVRGNFAGLKVAYANEIASSRDELRVLAAGSINVGKTEVDKVIDRLAGSFVDELFDLFADTDSVALDIGLEPDGIHTAFSMAFGHQTSWTARSLAGQADVKPGAPPAFAKMPAMGTWLAGFSKATAASDALAQPIARAAIDLTEALATDEGWSKQDRAMALDFVRLSFPKAADSVLVQGQDATAKPPTMPASPGLSVDMILMLTRTLRPRWSVAVVDQDTKPTIDWLKQLAVVIQRPELRVWIRKTFGLTIELETKVTSIDTKGLPAGSYGTSIEVAVVTNDPKAKETKKKHIEHVRVAGNWFVVPETPTRTWVASEMGLGLDKAALKHRLVSVMKGESSPTIGDRAGLDILLKGAPAFGLYMPLDTLAAVAAEMSQSAQMLQGDAASTHPAPSAPPTAPLPDGGRSGIAFASGAVRSATTVTATYGLFLPRDLFAIGADAFNAAKPMMPSMP